MIRSAITAVVKLDSGPFVCSAGPTNGGVTVTVAGINFRPVTVDNVNFVPVDDGGTVIGDPLPCRWLNVAGMTYTPTQITCVSPAGQGPRFVVRVAIGRDVATSTSTWSFLPPVVTSLTPSTLSPQVRTQTHARILPHITHTTPTSEWLIATLVRLLHRALCTTS